MTLVQRYGGTWALHRFPQPHVAPGSHIPATVHQPWPGFSLVQVSTDFECSRWSFSMDHGKVNINITPLRCCKACHLFDGDLTWLAHKVLSIFHRAATPCCRCEYGVQDATRASSFVVDLRQLPTRTSTKHEPRQAYPYHGRLQPATRNNCLCWTNNNNDHHQPAVLTHRDLECESHSYISTDCLGSPRSTLFSRAGAASNWRGQLVFTLG